MLEKSKTELDAMDTKYKSFRFGIGILSDLKNARSNFSWRIYRAMNVISPWCIGEQVFVDGELREVEDIMVVVMDARRRENVRITVCLKGGCRWYGSVEEFTELVNHCDTKRDQE